MTNYDEVAKIVRLKNMNCVESYRSSKTEVKNTSKIAGMGIFAKEKIKADEIIAIKNGYILTKEEFDKLDTECKPYCLQIDDQFFLGPKKKEEIPLNAIFINHSREPNVGFRGSITYAAMRDIETGEELTHDYAMCFTDLDHFSDLQCACGSNDCRKKLKNSDWKDKNLQKKYGKYFSSYILEKMKK